jgi:hypothetical protein
MANVLSSYNVQVFMAGNLEDAKRFIRQCCYGRGLCVTVTPTTFIYTAGEEAGFVVGFVNYPRFPKQPEEILSRARDLAYGLMTECCQRTSLIVASDITEWLTVDPPALREKEGA